MNLNFLSENPTFAFQAMNFEDAVQQPTKQSIFEYISG